MSVSVFVDWVMWTHQNGHMSKKAPLTIVWSFRNGLNIHLGLYFFFTGGDALTPLFVKIPPEKTVNFPLVALLLPPKTGFTSTGGFALS
jgi:hypothetical protein